MLDLQSIALSQIDEPHRPKLNIGFNFGGAVMSNYNTKYKWPDKYIVMSHAHIAIDLVSDSYGPSLKLAILAHGE
ncbi:hypothetical protein AB835_06480 [Candidatus Endobugula sertula]|uniref:Uncharacterized protein n=1 Tax=Candidatus Endobugula sertula TaxID=62101 RepID=A0A1D2QQM9_9GAMM|nr:hypothetical protein AB835_06480 [Candidatus Endobugula sertula]